jgi:hypothetical protein
MKGSFEKRLKWYSLPSSSSFLPPLGSDNPGSRYLSLSHHTPRSNFMEERQAMRYISEVIRS